MTTDLHGNAVPNLESTDPEADSTITIDDSATVSSKEERERELNRERVRRFRQKHKKRGRAVESNKPRGTNTRDTSTKRTASHTTPDRNHINIVVAAVMVIIFTVVIVAVKNSAPERSGSNVSH